MGCFAVDKKFIVFIGLVVFIALLSCAAGADNEYWDNGKLRVSRSYDAEGDLQKVLYYDQKGRLQQMEKYDNEGHKIELSYYDADGHLKETADGWAMMRWQYVDGKMVQESYYNAQGKLIEGKDYNDLGDLVNKDYVAGNGTLPAEEYNPEPTVAGESNSYYDQYGRLEGVSTAYGPMYDDGYDDSEIAAESAEMGDEEVGATATAMEAREYGD